MRNIMATHNLIAVSANNKETAINTEQTLDTTLLFSRGDVINLEPRRESNEDEATGYEEPDTIYDLGKKAVATLNAEKAQPQHFAFFLAYALGAISTAAAGSGYEHTLTPIDGEDDKNRSNPSFTAAQRYGKTVLKRRFASMFVDGVTATFAKDEWVKIAGEVKGSGKVADNIEEETVNAYDDEASLTLAANGVEGSSAAERLNNVQRIRVELSAGVWTEVEYSAVSADTPAVITITPPGAAHELKDYKVLYIPTESGWMTFPARITETPLRVAQMTLILGGTWSGSAFEGGREMAAEIKQAEWSFSNNGECEFVPGAGDAYASRYIRGGRTQAIKLDREFREYILQQHIDDNDTFGFYILCEGAVFDSPHKYQVEAIFPKVGVLSAPLSVDGKRMAEAGDLQILEDDTYGSVIVKVKNLQATYAA